MVQSNAVVTASALYNMILAACGRRFALAVQMAAVFVAMMPVSASADRGMTRLSIADAPAGTSGLGIGFRIPDSPYGGAIDSLDLVPLYLYEGKRFFLHGTSLGVHVLRNSRFEIDLIGRYRFWELDPDQDSFFAGLDERRQTVDAGVSIGMRREWGELRAEWLTDLLDRHGGHEVEATYRRAFDVGGWSLSPYVSLGWLGGNLSNYYFGVAAHEARPERAAYQPGAVFNLGYGLTATYRLGERAELFGNLGVIELDESIFSSPVVDQTVLATTFVGGSYFFGSVHQPAVGSGNARQSEWSWRVNFGYQAQGNIVGDIDQGDFRRSVDAQTSIGGFTVSRLLNASPRSDFYGRVALHRHFEGSAQEDFFSVAAYVMAVGKGYFPWSDQPSFRWGFGMGLSYAQKVPLIEQVKQTRKGERTARFLNYLEMTLDFPIGSLVSAGPFRNCFAGLTTVHRSGIFASSEILGDVAGGSDWITAHLECLR